MYKNLIEEARKEGFEEIVVETILQKDDGSILLTQDLQVVNPIYGLPSAELKKGEAISQGLQRGIMENTAMQLKEVKAYLGHYDLDGKRHYHFIAEVLDPYSLEENTNIAYAWLSVEDATGYPITDELREMLDLYAKFKKA